MGKLTDVKIEPGLFTLQTDRGSRNRWKSGDHVRFFRGQAQKLGGWVKASASTFSGICRGVIDWLSLAQKPLIMLGTHLKLYVYDSGTFNNVTPIRSSGTFAANPITTVNTFATVTIHHVGHGASAGDYVTIGGAAATGGITINGEYAITSITDADNYVITHSAPATSSVTGGGAAVTYAYQLPIGKADTSAGLGWGAGSWGLSTWGTPRSASTFIGLARTWTMDNWGEDVIACPRGGGIYVWDTSVGGATAATLIAGAPATAKAVIVSQEDRHLIVLGAHNGVTDDPLRVSWSDGEDYTTFTVTETNTAGTKRLDGGNEIYCAIKVGKEILIFTDTMFFSMIFSGPPYTFDFAPKGMNGSIAGPNAATEFDGRGFWMGINDFFVYDGRWRVQPCDVRNHVFDDFNVSQKAKVFAGANSVFGEVWWLYPSSGSSENDRYVLFNAWENHWTFGTIARTMFVGDSTVFEPYAAGSDGYLYSHENGVDDDVSALSSSLSSWDIEISEGDQLMLLSRLVPDFKTLAGSIELTVTGKEYPQSSDSSSEDVGAISSTTEALYPHLRCRQISLGFATSGVGADFRHGTLRIDVQPDGGQ